MQCLAILLRSFKREPFLVQSLIAASLTLAFAALDRAPMGQCRRGIRLSGRYGGIRAAFRPDDLLPRAPGVLGIGAAAASEKRDARMEFNRRELAGAKPEKERSQHDPGNFAAGEGDEILALFSRDRLLCSFYRLALPKKELRLSVDDFDGDLRLENLDVRETVEINVWHRPEFYDKNQRKLFCDAIEPGSVVLDVGANIGVYTLLAAKRGARVFAIEADPRNLEMLRHHVHLNGFDDRVTIFPIAVGSNEGAVTLYRFPGNWGHSNLFEGTDPVQVPCRTIDSLDLPPIGVCKMDIEGSELSALKGMEATIQRSPRMKLLIEYAEVLGASAEMTDFIRARFAPVYAIRQPPLRAKGPLSSRTRPPQFCDLWAFRA